MLSLILRHALYSSKQAKKKKQKNKKQKQKKRERERSNEVNLYTPQKHTKYGIQIIRIKLQNQEGKVQRRAVRCVTGRHTSRSSVNTMLEELQRKKGKRGQNDDDV